MWQVCLFVLMQAAGGGAAQGVQEKQPVTTAPTTAPTYDQGPLRCEPIAVFDARYWYRDEQQGPRGSELQMRFRVSGERIAEIVRFGNVILTEAVDDAGKSLIGPNTYTEEERTSTRPLTMAGERLRSMGLLLPCRLETPSRAAKSLKLHGTVRLVLAKEREQVTIDNPLQYVGKPLENEKLQALKVSLRLLSSEDIAPEEEGLPAANQMLIIQYLGGQDRVHSATPHDAYMKPLRSRERPLKLKGGGAAVGYIVAGGEINQDCQLVLEVFPTIEDARLPIEFDRLELP